MNPEALTTRDWELVKECVFSCQSLGADARQRWLDEHDAHPGVRREVERLLAAGPPAATFLELSAPRQLLGGADHMPSRVGRFRILHRLGAGGMGVVYAAFDEKLGRNVALKILHRDAGVSDEQRKRLLWEARAASALNHPNIVCVYDAGEDDGTDFIAMELVDGHSLAELLSTGSYQTTKLLIYAVQIAAALAAAHGDGILHRDLKPSNVMITGDGLAKLVDFGLAKSFGTALKDQSAPTTLRGQLAGTAAYMSPEQAEGGAVDYRTDVFSFGSVLYEMLTAQRAFVGSSSVSILAKIIQDHPRPLRELRPSMDPRLDDIVRRCMRKDRARRFQSMADVKVCLEDVLETPEPSREPVSHASRWLLPVVASTGLVAFVAAGLTYVWLKSTAAPLTPPELKRITWDAGLTTSPAVSRDGALLAYASDRAGRGDLDIWTQHLGGSDAVRLTTSAADDSRPTFSPDGTWVAFRSERDGGGVYVVPSLGGSERLLVPQCRDPQYSPDGQKLACWIGEVGGGFYPQTARIVVVPSSGGPPRHFRPDFESAAYPLWTVDGRALVFLGRKAGAVGSTTVDWWLAPDGDPGASATGALSLFNERGLTPLPGQFWIRPEAWSGERTLMFSAKQLDASNVWGVDITQGKVSRESLRPLTLGAGVQAFPDGPKLTDPPSLVFTSLAFDVQLRQLPLGEGRGEARMALPLLPTLANVGSPSVSSDGGTLVFSARQADGARIVAVQMPSSTQHTVATAKTTAFVRTVISGNGAYVAYNDGFVGYRTAVRDGVPEPLCERCGWPTHLSHDGSQVLFESAGSEERLLLWSDGVLRPLIAGDSAAGPLQYAGRFSPDGRFVALCLGDRDSPTRKIMIIPNAPHRPLRADEWIDVSEDASSEREPYWAPDGTRLYFVSDRDGFRCIWARNLDPKTGRPLGTAYPMTHFHHARELLRASHGALAAIGLSASRDSLIFTTATSLGNLWWQTRLPSR